MRKARQEQAEAAAAAEAAGISPVESQAASSSRYRFLPSRSATLGSVKDSTGGEVIGDRVLLYVHGKLSWESLYHDLFHCAGIHPYRIVLIICRRSVLLLFSRHSSISSSKTCSKSRSESILSSIPPSTPIPLRMFTIHLLPSLTANSQPCALLDALAAYLYLLSPPPGTHAPISPTSIIFMGDSAGGGLCISLLVLIREMGLPMPAGASLISPWVDLTHSMPSITGEPAGDFIPATG